jgi:hypothetical protein
MIPTKSILQLDLNFEHFLGRVGTLPARLINTVRLWYWVSCGREEQNEQNLATYTRLSRLSMALCDSAETKHVMTWYLKLHELRVPVQSTLSWLTKFEA